MPLLHPPGDVERDGEMTMNTQSMPNTETTEKFGPIMTTTQSPSEMGLASDEILMPDEML